MVKNKIIKTVMLGIVGVCVLTGCSLADKDMAEIAERDSLVGVFVTTKSIGTLEEIPCDVDIEAGTFKIEDIDVDGCYMIYAREGEGDDMYETLISDGISAGTSNVAYNENSDGSVSRNRSEKGCVYFDADNKDSYADSDGNVDMTLNRIYETPDHTYYITSESTMVNVSFSNLTESGAMEVKESYKTSSSLDSNNKTTDENEMAIQVEWKLGHAGEKYTFTAMSGDNKELDAKTYDVGDIPETIKFDCDWQYVIVSYADVTGEMHTSFADKEDPEYEYSVSTGKFFLDTGVVEIE